MSAATSITDVANDDHVLNGATWQAFGCSPAQVTSWCPPGEPKDFARPVNAEADPVTVYYGHVCSPIGETVEEATTAAANGLSLGEQTALESWVQADVLAPEAIDITPESGPVNLLNSLRLLEAALALGYGGTGVLHVPASFAGPLGSAGLIVPSGSTYRTWLGHTLALGAGYELNVGPGSAGTDGRWLYATGPVAIRRGPIVTLPAAVDTAINDRYVLAERTYVVQVECAVYAIETTGASCCDGGSGGDGGDGNFLELEN